MTSGFGDPHSIQLSYEEMLIYMRKHKNKESNPAVFKMAFNKPVLISLFPCTGTTILASSFSLIKT